MNKLYPSIYSKILLDNNAETRFMSFTGLVAVDRFKNINPNNYTTFLFNTNNLIYDEIHSNFYNFWELFNKLIFKAPMDDETFVEVNKKAYNLNGGYFFCEKNKDYIFQEKIKDTSRGLKHVSSYTLHKDLENYLDDFLKSNNFEYYDFADFLLLNKLNA